MGARRSKKGFSNSFASFGKRVRPQTKPTKRERSVCEKLSRVLQKICATGDEEREVLERREEESRESTRGGGGTRGMRTTHVGNGVATIALCAAVVRH